MGSHEGCVICGTDMTEVFHYPVKNYCACKTRVCQHCRARVHTCPTCRFPNIGSDVDALFLQNLTLAVKGKTCEGCSRYIRSRHTVKHGQECAMLLALRLREVMDENLQQEKKYRDVFQHSEHLSMQISTMTFHMRNRQHFTLQEAIAAEEDSDEEVLETFHLHLPPPAAPPPSRSSTLV